jgi:hypothetical protein
VRLTIHLHLGAKLRMSGIIATRPLYTFTSFTEKNFLFFPDYSVELLDDLNNKLENTLGSGGGLSRIPALGGTEYDHEKYQGSPRSDRDLNTTFFECKSHCHRLCQVGLHCILCKTHVLEQCIVFILV